MGSLIVKYEPKTERLYLNRFDYSIGPEPIIVVFSDSFKLPPELMGIMQRQPIYDHVTLINRSLAILRHLRKTGQKAAIKGGGMRCGYQKRNLKKWRKKLQTLRG